MFQLIPVRVSIVRMKVQCHPVLPELFKCESHRGTTLEESTVVLKLGANLLLPRYDSSATCLLRCCLGLCVPAIQPSL